MSRAWLCLSPPARRMISCSPAGREVDAIPGPVIDAHLRNTLSHRSDVAGVTKRQPPDPDQDSSSSLPIAKPVKPSSVQIGLTDFDHQ